MSGGYFNKYKPALGEYLHKLDLVTKTPPFKDYLSTVSMPYRIHETIDGA